MKDDISKSFGLTPIKATEVAQVIETPPQNVENDYEYARKNLYDLIEKGQSALDSMADIADMSQHPRSYEVIATLVNALTQANKSLLTLNKQRQELDRATDNKNKKVVNNNLFVGNPNELAALVKEMKKSKED
jgi:hypothetical protein